MVRSRYMPDRIVSRRNSTISRSNIHTPAIFFYSRFFTSSLSLSHSLRLGFSIPSVSSLPLETLKWVYPRARAAGGRERPGTFALSLSFSRFLSLPVSLSLSLSLLLSWGPEAAHRKPLRRRPQLFKRKRDRETKKKG